MRIEWSVWVLLLATGCSDREELLEEPDRVALCAEHCAQVFGSCNPADPANSPGGPQTEDECNSNCVDDLAWEGVCRFKYGEKMTCSTELSCEEFKVHQVDVINDPCFKPEGDWSSCVGGGA